MGSMFNLDFNELFTFFIVLIRISTALILFPIFGEKNIPTMAKILLSLSISIAVYPGLVSQGLVIPGNASFWLENAYSLCSTVALEAVLGLALGYVVKIIYDCFQFGGDLIGQMMGLSAASQFDPSQESQTQIVTKFQMTLAALFFLAIDGHHFLLQGLISTYRWVQVGGVNLLTGSFASYLLQVSGQFFWIGLQIAAPMLIVSFGINVAYGVISKAMPQMNILVLSFSISAIVGFFVMFMSLDAFHDVAIGVFSKMEEQMFGAIKAMAGK